METQVLLVFNILFTSLLKQYGYDISGGEGLEEEFGLPSVVGDTEILMKMVLSKKT